MEKEKKNVHKEILKKKIISKTKYEDKSQKQNK